MSQLLLNKLKNLAGVSALLVAFFIVGTVDAKAQSVSRASNEANTQTLVAQKLGITACAMGTATNVQGGLATLQSQVPALRASLNDGSATLSDKLKYFYYEGILNDTGAHDVAAELSLLSNLPKAAKSTQSENITNQMLANLYNSTKTLFGMCN